MPVNAREQVKRYARTNPVTCVNRMCTHVTTCCHMRRDIITYDYAQKRVKEFRLSCVVTYPLRPLTSPTLLPLPELYLTSMWCRVLILGHAYLNMSYCEQTVAYSTFILFIAFLLV